jgi:hypothetical protein
MDALDIKAGDFLYFNTRSGGVNYLGTLTCSGTFNFRKSLAQAIVNDSLGEITTTTSGTINIDTSCADAFLNHGIFTNSDLVDVDSSARREITNYPTASFVNYGRLYFTDVFAEGFLNSGVVTNDQILIEWDSKKRRDIRMQNLILK